MTGNKLDISRQLIMISILGILCSLWGLITVSVFIPLFAVPFVFALAYSIALKKPLIPCVVIIATSVIYLIMTSGAVVYFFESVTNEPELFFVFVLPFIIVLSFIPISIYILKKNIGARQRHNYP